jgi:hypothetical protein
VLFAQLVDDPSSLPEEVPTEQAQEQERQRLFGIIQALVLWENSNNKTVLDAARREIARSVARTAGVLLPETADEVHRVLAEYAPPVLDPFCGGGSIPLEAQRLGLEAHASDLNPVAVLITKALIEIRPSSRANRRSTHSHAPGWVLRAVGREHAVWPRTCAITASGCATRPRSASATSTRRSSCRKSRATARPP